jgi:glycosyltransferase involved in cell wall biosynthesis
VTRVLLCHQPTDGGVGRHLGDLTEGLTERGWEVVLCSPEPPRRLGGSVTHVRLDLRRAISPRVDLAAGVALARAVRELRPDVVHAHSSKAGAVARLARVLHPRVPLVYTPHGYAFAGHFSRREQRAAYRGIERLLSPLANRVVCVCEAEARLARSVGAGERVRVIHNGIEPARPGPGDARIARIAQRGPVIGALTMLRPGKGLETLIDAAPAMLARHPAAQIAIVGDGPELGTLRDRAQSRGVAHAVHFPGSSDRPLEALRAVDVFVHPSWAESFPYVLLEAMTLGKPIVASDVGGVSEAIEGGVSGLLVAPRDRDSLAGALGDLLEHRERAARMGELALARVRSQFTLAGMIDRLSAVYDELVRPSRPTAALQPRDAESKPLGAGLATPHRPPTMTGHPTQ